MIKLLLTLGHVRLIKGQICPAGLVKGFGKGHVGARNRKKQPLNNPRYSGLPGSGPDPNIVYQVQQLTMRIDELEEERETERQARVWVESNRLNMSK